MKKGIATTEFYVVVAGILVSALVLFKSVPEDSADSLVPLIADGLEKIAALIVAISTIIAYVRSRTQLKKLDMKQGE